MQILSQKKGSRKQGKWIHHWLLHHPTGSCHKIIGAAPNTAITEKKKKGQTNKLRRSKSAKNSDKGALDIDIDLIQR